MPEELKEIYAQEEAKKAEEEAKKRPEPPTPKSMRERVAEESKRRKDAHLAELKRQGEEERARKQAERDAETARRQAEDPNYVPPPPLTVPKGKPKPPPGYVMPEKAKKFYEPDPQPEVEYPRIETPPPAEGDKPSDSPGDSKEKSDTP